MSYREWREQREIKYGMREEIPMQEDYREGPKPKRPVLGQSLPYSLMLATLNEYKRIVITTNSLIERIATYSMYSPQVSQYDRAGGRSNQPQDISDRLAKKEQLIRKLKRYMMASNQVNDILYGLENDIDPLDALYIRSVYGRLQEEENKGRTKKLINQLLSKGVELPMIKV